MSQTNLTASNDVTTIMMSSNSEEESGGEDVMQILQSIIASVGIVANLTVVIVFSNHKKLRRKIPNRFIVNQSLLDFVVSVVLLLTTLIIKDTYSVANSDALGYIECTMWNSQFLLWALFVASSWNIVTMTYERYLELVHPIWHKTHFKIRWIYLNLFANVALSISFHAAYLIPTSKVIGNACMLSVVWPSRLFSSAFGVFVIVIQFIAPLIILVYCNGRIVWVLTRRIDSNLDNLSSNENQLNSKFLLARTNTIKTFLLVGIFFIICWINDEVYYLMYNFGYDVNWNSTYFKFCVLMIFVNCTINPFIYLFKYQDYQVALKYLFGCKFQKDTRATGDSTGTTVSNIS